MVEGLGLSKRHLFYLRKLRLLIQSYASIDATIVDYLISFDNSNYTKFNMMIHSSHGILRNTIIYKITSMKSHIFQVY